MISLKIFFFFKNLQPHHIRFKLFSTEIEPHRKNDNWTAPQSWLELRSPKLVDDLQNFER